MKITLVTVERSSWISPELLSSSALYVRTNVSTAFSVYPQDSSDPIPVAHSFRKGSTSGVTPSRLPSTVLLPAYPLSYILCKDVYNKITGMVSSAAQERVHLLERSQSSGGIFCCNYKSASEHSSPSSEAAFEMASDGMIVRIPGGSQNLGYVQQIVPRDESSAYDPEMGLGREFHLPRPVNVEMGMNADFIDAAALKAGGAGAAAAAAAHGMTDGGKEATVRPNFGVRRMDMSPDSKGDGEDEAKTGSGAGAAAVAPTASASAKAASGAWDSASEMTNGVNGSLDHEESAAAGKKAAAAAALDELIVAGIRDKLLSGDQDFKLALREALGIGG